MVMESLNVILMCFVLQQGYGQQSYSSYAQPAAADTGYSQTTPAAGGYAQQQQQYGSSYGQPASGEWLKILASKRFCFGPWPAVKPNFYSCIKCSVSVTESLSVTPREN